MVKIVQHHNMESTNHNKHNTHPLGNLFNDKVHLTTTILHYYESNIINNIPLRYPALFVFLFVCPNVCRHYNIL